MTKLYEWPPTRSQRAKWALKELGIEYSSHMINLMAGQQNSDAYRAIHPLGVVPALQTDAYTIFESVAIVLQLIDEHPETEDEIREPLAWDGIELLVQNEMAVPELLPQALADSSYWPSERRR